MARVNLLPPEVSRRSAQRRATMITAALLLLYLVLLGLLYAVKLVQVNEARAARDATQAEVAAVQSQLAALQPFRELDAQIQERNRLLAGAMASEVSVARLLNELSLTFPATSSLRALSVTLQPPPPADASPAPAPAPGATPAPAPAPGATPAPEPVPSPAPGAAEAGVEADEPIGTVTFEGYSVEQYSPGVEAVVVDVARVPGFRDPFVAAAQVEQIGDEDVTAFSGNADVTATAYTRRYEGGLPLEGLR